MSFDFLKKMPTPAEIKEELFAQIKVDNYYL